LIVDGSSPFPFILTYFPEEIDDSNLPPHWDIAQSLQLETSPTLLYDAETGMSNYYYYYMYYYLILPKEERV